MSAPNMTSSSPTETAIPPFSPSTYRATPSSQTESSGRNSTLGRLLWLAVGVGAAYFIIKTLPEGRRYLRLERM